MLGAFLIGLIAETALKNHTENTGLTLFLKTGVCGGFTTFSTFSLESAQLLSEGRQMTAVLYMAGSVLCCLAGVFCGQMLARKIG